MQIQAGSKRPPRLKSPKEAKLNKHKKKLCFLFICVKEIRKINKKAHTRKNHYYLRIGAYYFVIAQNQFM